MRLDRSLLSLMARSSVVGLVALSGCPASPPPVVSPRFVPGQTTPNPTPVTPVPAKPATLPDGTAPCVEPEVAPSSSPSAVQPRPGLRRQRTSPPACGGVHQSMDKCAHCDYCPPCGGG